jgi:glycosyltransferase domain-containing protein
MIKDKFTLIITVHEDLSYIDKALDYYKDAPFNVIVADSSRELGDYEKTVPSNVSVIHEPGKFWYKKIYDRFNNIETPYVLDMSDDDIIHINAIEQCVEFLENNSDFVVASGNWDGEKVPENIKTDDFMKRIIFNMERIVNAPNHSVYRTEVLRDCYLWVSELSEGFPIRWWDKFLAFTAYFYGNLANLDIDYGIGGPSRRMDTFPHLIPEREKLYYNLTWLDVFKDHDNFAYPISLVESRGIDPVAARDFVVYAFDRFSIFKKERHKT